MKTTNKSQRRKTKNKINTGDLLDKSWYEVIRRIYCINYFDLDDKYFIRRLPTTVLHKSCAHCTCKSNEHVTSNGIIADLIMNRVFTFNIYIVI